MWVSVKTLNYYFKLEGGNKRLAYVEPKSTIYLIEGCPCDRSYNNTLYFENKREQWLYMRNHATHTFTDQYYQRYERGYLRINENAEKLYEVNYMAFSNDRTFNPAGVPTNNQKIFYCFVDNIEYINENCTEIHYTIDIMQTYFFDYQLGYCMVDREHTITDNLFENLVPEPVTCTEFEYRELNNISLPKIGRDGETYTTNLYSLMIEYMPNTHCITSLETLIPNTDPTDASNYWDAQNMRIVWSPIDDTLGTLPNTYTQGEMRNNNYCGTRYVFLDIPPAIYPTPGDSGNGSTIQQYMGRLLVEMLGSGMNKGDYPFILKGLNSVFSNKGQRAAIVNLTIVPRTFKSSPPTSDKPWYSLTDAYTPTFISTYSINKATSFYSTYLSTNYTPKNKKMLSYPFSSIIVTNDNGDERQYLWEEFYDKNYRFRLQGVNVSTPTATLTPVAYRGRDIDIGKMSVQCTDFPTAKWTEDSYLSYIASNKGAMLSQAAQAMSGMVSGAIGRPRTVGTIRGYYGGDSTTMSGSKIDMKYSRATGKPLHIAKTVASTTSAEPRYSKQGNIIEYVPDAGSMIGAGGSLVDMATKLADTSASPDPTYGSTNYSAIRSVNNLYGFKILEQFPRIESAKRIDNYFTLFGYAINDVKIPNIKSQPKTSLRPHWNYIKNIYTVILPFDDGNTQRYVSTDVEENLQAIYDKGITFWMKGGEVGDYSLDNSPQI